MPGLTRSPVRLEVLSITSLSVSNAVDNNNNNNYYYCYCYHNYYYYYFH